jgi:hypothetical protein
VHLTIALLLSLLALSQAQTPTESALVSDPKGWVDLLADKTLKEWTRVPLSAVGQLPAGQVSQPSPWTLDPSGMLVCDGDKSGHEMFRYGTELGDFVLHVEWRFTKLEGDKAYNSGVYVRTGADGTIWFQAQTGAAGGYLFGNAPVNGTVQRVNLRQAMTENRVKPAGEWNIYEIRAVGKKITLWVNGAVTNEYAECEVPRGYVGFEAEGYRIEFRNLKLKRLQ